MRGPVEARFWAKVAPADALGCWEWTAHRNPDGYGNFWNGERLVRAHRWAYESLRVAIPTGLHLDHLCRNRACVNPWHLEPVTNRENAQRGASLRTHCKHGHELTPENVRICVHPHGEFRACRTCLSTSQRRRRARKQQIAIAAASEPTSGHHHDEAGGTS